uniref:Uncharacterized protein n=1 Tax=Cucumis melo TaxID=3656 RepID=A0A9I9DK19_CUCME
MKMTRPDDSRMVMATIGDACGGLKMAKRTDLTTARRRLRWGTNDLHENE